VNSILKAKGNITIDTLQRAAALVGRELRLELVGRRAGNATDEKL
jgi:antitoxin HicB